MAATKSIHVSIMNTENKHIKHVERYFTVERVIGKGAFGQVLVTSTVGGNKYTRYATKCILPVQRPIRLASELRYLRDLGGQCNVVRLHTAQLHKGSLYIVMDMIEPDPFEQLVCSFSRNEIATYIRKLLEALKHIHSHNVIHRDIKPHNFLHNRARGEYLLVDFGLATQVRTRTAAASASLAGSLSGTPIRSGDRKQTMTPGRPELLSAHHATANPPLHATANRHFTGAKLFGDAERPARMISNISNSPYVNPSRMVSPIKQQNFGSPLIHNISTKRNHHVTNDTNDSIQMFKKLRVSNNIISNKHHVAASATNAGAVPATADEAAKEPIRLTVGAYESPVTGGNETPRQSARQLDNQDGAFSTPKPPRPVCMCRNEPKTCATCMSKPESPAARSGTASFKALEVLLHYIDQRTPLDVWAAGVILFCLLAGHTPLFRDRDDSMLVAEIITLLGSRVVKEAAEAMNIRLTVSDTHPGMDLKELCQTIRRVSKDARKDVEIPDEAYHLLYRMLDPNPKTRITASDALDHPWLSGGGCEQPAAGAVEPLLNNQP